jgi:hypothetical protein
MELNQKMELIFKRFLAIYGITSVILMPEIFMAAVGKWKMRVSKNELIGLKMVLLD